MNVIARKPTLARHNMVSRYSNLNPANYNFGGSYNSYGGTQNPTNGSGLGTQSGGSGIFNWNNLVDGIVDIGKTFVSSFWNKGDAATANALNEMYNEQKKTTYILWAIIGIVLVLAAVVIIKKK